MNKANFSPLVQKQGKCFSTTRTAHLPHCAWVMVRHWKPAAKPMTLSVPNRGLLQVDDPGTFALNCLVELDLMLSGGVGPNGFTTEQLLDMMKAVGCDCYLEPTKEGSSEN